MPLPKPTATALHGLFDGFVKSMEAGYAGDDSAYAQRKKLDEQKEMERRKRSEERKRRGFTELKDVKEHHYSEMKYDHEEKEDPFTKFLSQFKK